VIATTLIPDGHLQASGKDANIATTAKLNKHVSASSADANMPLLAIRAAREIDELIEGRETTLDSVALLAEVLKRSFRLDQPDAMQNLIDSGRAAVFLQAMDELSAGHGALTVKELDRQATEIVNALETCKWGSPVKILEKMRGFCTALASGATAYQQSVFEMRRRGAIIATTADGRRAASLS
jgi:hypothetical protein